MGTQSRSCIPLAGKESRNGKFFTEDMIVIFCAITIYLCITSFIISEIRSILTS